MYYQEKIIDGEYFYRTTPDGEWKKMSNKMLTEKIKDAHEAGYGAGYREGANDILSSI